MNARNANSGARLTSLFAGLSLLAILSMHCSSAGTEAVGSESAALKCNQDDCTGNPPGRPPCGTLDNACCNTDAGPSCHDGSVCDDTNTCATSCGAKGFPCCAGNLCANSLACTSGTCGGPCGGAGQTCCFGTGCNSGLSCGTNDVCQAPPPPPPPCGNIGQACCKGTTCNSLGLACESGKCAPLCGYLDGPCCPPSISTTGCPTSPFLGCDHTFNRCESCGLTGEVCCEQGIACNSASDACHNNVCTNTH